MFLVASDRGIICIGAGRPFASRVEFTDSPVEEPVAVESFVDNSPSATSELSSVTVGSKRGDFDLTAVTTNGSDGRGVD